MKGLHSHAIPSFFDNNFPLDLNGNKLIFINVYFTFIKCSMELFITILFAVCCGLNRRIFYLFLFRIPEYFLSIGDFRTHLKNPAA